MNMRDILDKLDEIVAEQQPHLSRAYDLRNMKQVEGPYYVNAEEHDPGQYSFELYKKVVDTEDKMEPAYQDMGYINGLSSYRSTWDDVVAAAKQMIAKLGQ